MNGKTILVVDDERHIVDLVKLYLTQENYRVEVAYNGIEAEGMVRSLQPALVVLDLMLPGIDGLELCRRIRRDSDVPIIMLTARGEDIDKIIGLEIGADDYLAKPFNPRELVARIKAILRRQTAPRTRQRTPLTLGNTIIDPDRHEVWVANTEVELRSKEYDLLLFLAENLGRVLERDRLLNEVWSYEYFGDTRTVDVHVAHLRDRLAGSDLSIQTVRGVGYKMVLAHDA